MSVLNVSQASRKRVPSNHYLNYILCLDPDSHSGLNFDVMSLH